MKSRILMLVLGVAVLTGSCRNEITPPEISGNSGTGGQCRITIIGEGDNSASRGSVHFEGGTASGAGLYHSDDTPVVSAEPSPGYEISHFFGGPQSVPRLYDYEKTRESSFKVDMSKGDHFFEVRFKEKIRNLTVNAGEGGTAGVSGDYQCDVPHVITAVPSAGYAFTGWQVNEGDVSIADVFNARTTATLNNENSTITAVFEKNKPQVYFSIKVIPAAGDPNWQHYIVITGRSTRPLPNDLNINVSYTCTSYSPGGSVIDSGQDGRIVNGVIKAGNLSGEKVVYGCGARPENLRITSVQILSPAGWEGVIR